MSAHPSLAMSSATPAAVDALGEDLEMIANAKTKEELEMILLRFQCEKVARELFSLRRR